MKKLISILAAAVLLACCFSCDDKKNNRSSEIKPAVTEAVTGADGVGGTEADISAEPVFGSYSEDYFHTVNVSRTDSDQAPPLEEHSINLYEMDFGSRISPCKDEKYRERYKAELEERYKKYYEDDADERYEYWEYWEDSLSEPALGNMNSYFLDGNTLYLAVYYDMICSGQHEVSIFRADGTTGEKEEIFRHSDPENSLEIYQLYVFRETLYVLTKENGLCRLDEEKGELVQLLPPCVDSVFDYPVDWIRENSADRLIVSSLKTEYKEVPDDYNPEDYEVIQKGYDDKLYLILNQERIIREYDPENDTWSELYDFVIAEDGISEDETTENEPMLYGELFAWTEKPEGSRKYDVVTENYRVSTGLTACDILYAGSDKLVVQLGSRFIVHWFDLEKKEHYIFDYDGLGTQCSVFGDSLVVSSSTPDVTKAYYIIPELGLTFRLDRDIHVDNAAYKFGFGAINSTLEYGSNNALSYRIGYFEDIPEDGNDMDVSDIKDLLIWYSAEDKNG